jgi:hypothetical protein
MTRLITTLLLVASTAGAQAAPDRQSGSRGVLAQNWNGHIDASAEKAGMKITDVRFEAVGEVLQVTSGPAAYYWNPGHVARGSYTVKATFSQRAPTAKPEAYGIFIGGAHLGSKAKNYLYCVVFGAGMYSVKHQFGEENHTLVNLKPSSAVQKTDNLGRATNALAWRVTPDHVSCLVNDSEVERFDRAAVLGPGKLESTDGVYGLRVNHNLTVHITDFGMVKLP